MKLAEYIKHAIDNGQRKFDIGIYYDRTTKTITVDDASPNRIRFEVAPITP